MKRRRAEKKKRKRREKGIDNEWKRVEEMRIR